MPKTDYELHWYGKEVGTEASRKLRINSKRAALFLETRIIKSISRSQPVSRGAKGKMRGLKPSKPGEPPKMVTGHLRASIDNRVEPKRNAIDIVVSAGAKYAEELEKGSGELKPRPFMRPALETYRGRLIEMMTKNIFQRRGTWDRRRSK